MLLALICLLSGAAGLIFETAWFHRAGLVFGSSVWSTTLVLSSFMGGLTVGAALVARFGTRIRQFLIAYAAAELTVAGAGIFITYILPALTNTTANLVYSDGRVWETNIVRFVAGFFILLIPATAMGATLPLLAAALTSAGRGFGAALGWAYGWNTLGAVAGAIGAELALVPWLGVGGSAWLAAVLCVIAAVLGARCSALGTRERLASTDLADSTVEWPNAR